MVPTQDPFGVGGNDGLSLSSSADSPSFDLNGFNSQDSSGTSSFADPTAPGLYQNSPSYFSGSNLFPSTGQPSPFNGFSGTTQPQTGSSLGSIFGQLGNALFGSPATPAGPATAGLLGNTGLAQNGALTTTGLLAIGAAVIGLVLLLRS